MFIYLFGKKSDYICYTSDGVILHIDKQQTHQLYDICYKLLKCYSENSHSKLSQRSKVVI